MVFSFSSDPRGPIDKALQEKGALIAERFFINGLASIDIFQNFLLVHINPPQLADGTFVYNGVEEYSLASLHVSDELSRQHIKQMITKASTVFNSGLGPKKYGNAYAGILFERICLYLEPINGLSFNATSLSTEEALMSFLTVPNETFLLLSGWEKLKQPPVNKLITASVSNFESSNAFYVVDDSPNSFQLAVLQFAVVLLYAEAGELSPVKVNGLVNIMNGFPESVRESIHGLNIVFITPFEGRCLSKKQELTTSKGKEFSAEIIPDIVKDSQQFLFKYRL